MNEQQQLIRAIFDQNQEQNQTFDFDPRGLAIYQKSLQASAVRALRITYPTVLKLIGDDVFAYATEQLIKQDPPSTGDWALWGEHFSTVLKQLDALQEFPYVADIARLDFALHILGREKDTAVDMNSMSLLATCELEELRIVLNPALKLFVSKFPIVDIYNANHSQESQVETYLTQAKQKLTEGSGQVALIYRPQYKPLLRILEPSEHDWLKLIQQGCCIGQSLDRLVGHDQNFSLETWLPLAIQQNLILRLEKI